MDNNIIIKETLDGKPLEDAATRKRRQRSPKGAGTAKKRTADPFIWGIYLLLLLISVIELFSASSSEITTNVYGPLIRHGIFLAMGLLIVIVISNLHYGYISRFAFFIGTLSLLLLVISTFFGAEINGAQRAIIIGPITIQPPEIAKLAVVIVLATILGRNQQPGGVTTRAVILVGLVVIVFAALLWINGLTNTILLMGVSICMFLIGGIQGKKLAAIFAVYLVCGGLLFAIKYATPKSTEFDKAAQGTELAAAGSGVGRQETHIERIKRFITGVSPEDAINDNNRQVIYANMAQANGGLIGKGPGNSRENARLPLAFSDYIYSIIIEDTGFIGGICLMLIYLFLLARAGRIAWKCNRAFPAFLIMGCAVLIVFQALVHMAIVTGLFPVSGQPLPFISKGGTSILVMSAAIGIMLSVSKYATTDSDKKANTEELSQLPENMRAANISSL